MGRMHLAMTSRRRRRPKALNAEMQQARANANHINQRIDGAHLMEMHLLSRHPMHMGFGIRQELEHFQHLGFQRFRPRGLLQLGLEARPMAMRW